MFLIVRVLLGNAFDQLIIIQTAVLTVLWIKVNKLAPACFSAHLIDQARKNPCLNIFLFSLSGKYMPFQLVIHEVVNILLELLWFIPSSTVVLAKSTHIILPTHIIRLNHIILEYPASQLTTNHAQQSRMQVWRVSNVDYSFLLIVNYFIDGRQPFLFENDNHPFFVIIQ